MSPQNFSTVFCLLCYDDCFLAKWLFFSGVKPTLYPVRFRCCHGAAIDKVESCSTYDTFNCYNGFFLFIFPFVKLPLFTTGTSSIVPFVFIWASIIILKS